MRLTPSEMKKEEIFLVDKHCSCLSLGSISCRQHKALLEKEQAELASWQNVSLNHRRKELCRFIAVL